MSRRKKAFVNHVNQVRSIEFLNYGREKFQGKFQTATGSVERVNTKVNRFH